MSLAVVKTVFDVRVHPEVVEVRPLRRAFEVAVIARQGLAGPPGPDAEAELAGYVHDQASPSATWTINHNLGRRPLVTLLTTGGVEFDAQLTHTSINQVVASLATAIAGTARCL